MTNRQLLSKLIREADEMTLVFIRERLLHICDMYTDADRVREDFKRELPANSIFSPSWAEVYIRSAKTVREALETHPIEKFGRLEVSK